jgi:acetoacetyl-CoA synthetase
VIGGKGARLATDLDAMPGAKFFPDAKLNFAENLLRRTDAREALVFRGEDKRTERMTVHQVGQDH